MTQQVPQEAQLERSIRLPGSVALVVGGVIGAGIYVLVGKMAAPAGYAIWLTFAVAIGISLIGVLPLIQLAGALPRAGAGYFFSSRLLSPYCGALVSNLIVLGGGCSTCVVALTVAIYSKELHIPFDLPITALAIAILLAFYALYQFGLRLAMSLQVIMAIQFVSVLLVYGLVGAFKNDLHLALFPEQGFGAFVMAVLLCYSTCMGFQVVGEMGEEIHNARRNIPLALLIGGLIVAAVYIMAGLVFVSSIPYDPEYYKSLDAPISASAARFLPGWMVTFLGVGAITAGLTSLNAGAIALPRELFSQARDGLMPSALARVSTRTHTPHHAITAFFAFVTLILLCGRLAGQDIDFFAYMAAIGILVMSAVICVASLRLRKVYPEHHANAYIRFPHWLMVLCTVVTILMSLGFGAVVALERPSVMLCYATWVVVISLWYLWRRRSFTEEDWARMRGIPGEDEAL